MSDTVFVNGRGIVCKSSTGKSMVSFPDVCLTPPSPPAGPIPIPYPNTASASDLAMGSKSVKVEGKAVCLQDTSYFKKSMGDEAATKGQGGNVVTHTIRGKLYFVSWSLDVEFEGKAVCRHLDIATHNHNPRPGGTAPWPHKNKVQVDDVCAELEKEVEQADADLPPSKKKSAHTVTAAKYTRPNGESSVLWASSTHLSNRAYGGMSGNPAALMKLGGTGETPWVAGRGGPGARYNTISDIPGYAHPLSPAGPKCSHTEARILDTIFDANPQAGKGHKVTFRIKWMSSKGESRAACDTCRKAIEAAENAGMEIKIC